MDCTILVPRDDYELAIFIKTAHLVNVMQHRQKHFFSNGGLMACKIPKQRSCEHDSEFFLEFLRLRITRDAKACLRFSGRFPETFVKLNVLNFWDKILLFFYLLIQLM